MEYLSNNLDIEDFSAMDNLGNRTGTITQRDGVRDYTTDALTNRYTAINSPTQNLFYDLAGNLTQDHNGYHYVYDYENRITRIFKDVNANRVYDSGIDTNIAEYAYDALGRRIKKVDAIASETTVYYYSDNWQVLAEYDGSGGFQAYYVFGNYIDEVLLRHVIPAQAGIQDFYYLHDHLYSPVALLDDTGAVVERYEYDAYGKVTLWNAAFTTSYTTSQYGNPYAFTGRELDTLDAGNCTLMHYRHRDYSPPLGRFFQQDPHGINPAGGEVNAFYFENQHADGLNIYQYTSNNPLTHRDPRGLRRVRIQILVEYVNNAKKFPLPSMSSIEEEYKSIVTPCFTKLSCDEVTIKFTLSQQDTNLGLIKISSKPIAYRNLVSFDGKESNTVPIALSGGDKTTVWPYVFEKQATGTKWYHENRGIAYANILVHETLWHGLLDKGDDRKAKPGTFRSTACDRFKMVLTEDDCKLIRKKLKVK